MARTHQQLHTNISIRMRRHTHTHISETPPRHFLAPEIREMYIKFYISVCRGVCVVAHTDVQGPDLHATVCRAAQNEPLLVGQRQRPSWRRGEDMQMSITG